MLKHWEGGVVPSMYSVRAFQAEASNLLLRANANCLLTLPSASGSASRSRIWRQGSAFFLKLFTLTIPPDYTGNYG